MISNTPEAVCTALMCSLRSRPVQLPVYQVPTAGFHLSPPSWSFLGGETVETGKWLTVCGSWTGATGSRLHPPNGHGCREGVCGKHETKMQRRKERGVVCVCMPAWYANVCVKLSGGWLWSLWKGCWPAPMQTSLLYRGVDSLSERRHCPLSGPSLSLAE